MPGLFQCCSKKTLKKTYETKEPNDASMNFVDNVRLVVTRDGNTILAPNADSSFQDIHMSSFSSEGSDALIMQEENDNLLRGVSNVVYRYE